jgi:hypothetical protein
MSLSAKTVCTTFSACWNRFSITALFGQSFHRISFPVATKKKILPCCFENPRVAHLRLRLPLQSERDEHYLAYASPKICYLCYGGQNSGMVHCRNPLSGCRTAEFGDPDAAPWNLFEHITTNMQLHHSPLAV